MNPEELRFAKTHEWVHVDEADGERIATVGISAFAVEALTDLVYIGLPEIGRNVQAGESFSEIESVKAVSDIYAPVAGEVVAVNTELPDNLDILGKDAFGQGWIAKIKITDESGLNSLMDYSAYQKMCAEEAH